VFRDNVIPWLKAMQAAQVPLLVFSAGIAELIEEVFVQRAGQYLPPSPRSSFLPLYNAVPFDLFSYLSFVVAALFSLPRPLRPVLWVEYACHSSSLFHILSFSCLQII